MRPDAARPVAASDRPRESNSAAAVNSTDGTPSPSGVVEARCAFCDVAADYYGAKALALAAGDHGLAAQADALGALGADAATVAHGLAPVVEEVPDASE